MLALHRQSASGNEYQRRPTRFSSSFDPPRGSSTTATSQQHHDAQHQQAKLKCSTITRVSAASRSRLRPPVASLASKTGSGESACNLTSCSSGGPTSRARPSSLALKIPESSSSSSRSSAGSRIGSVSSILPKISSHTSRLSLESSAGNSKPKVATKDNKEPSSLKSLNNSCSGGNNRQIVRRQNASCKQSSAVTSQSSEMRLSGAKNLVAVVHPQHSQRVNSNPVSNANKLTIMKSTAATASIKSKIENGKLGSSYLKRDAKQHAAGSRGTSTTRMQQQQQERRPETRVRSGEGKQDEGQIVAPHSSVKATATSTTLTAEAFDVATTIADQTTSPHHYSSCCSSSSCSPTTTSGAEDKSDQFKLASSSSVYNNSNSNNNHNHTDNNDSTNYLDSVASNDGDLHLDKEHQPGNIKQSNKHLSARTYPSVSTQPTTSFLDQQTCGISIINSSDANEYDDCNNNKHAGAKSSSLTTNSHGLTLKVPKRTTITHAINNDHLLPKPMGQQVLSLMMLDVGLLPATTGNTFCHQQQEQSLSSKRRRSHVRLQSPTRASDTIGRARGIGSCGGDSHLLDNCSSFINHDQNLANRLSSSIDYDDHELCNNFHSLQQPRTPAHRAHEMLRLQVRLSKQDNEKLKSLSLPSSPQSGYLGYNRNRSVGNDESAYLKHPISNSLRQSNSAHQTSNRIQHDNCRTKTSTPTSITQPPVEQQPLSLNGHLISICDNQDSSSLTSSSCSSLNHCPPLLALSNQFNVLKFEELVSKVNVEHAARNSKEQNGLLCEVSTCPLTTISNIESSNSQSSDQTTNEKQHEGFEIDYFKSKIQKHLPDRKIDRNEELSENSEVLRFPTVESLQATNNLNYSNRPYRQEQITVLKVQLDEAKGNNEHLNHQFRRQQQPRSHSISGQEFHPNGGYQRLKQSLYNGQQQHHHHQQQQGAFEGLQNYGVQSTSSRMQQLPSPYQHHQFSGRSPSPLSINCQTHYNPQLGDGSLKQYPLDPNARQPRNQLHASLECLNSNYSDYHQVQRLQEQQQQQLLSQQHQQQLQNQHYAASYVLATPPANTVINSNGDQDLAAAAMGAPPSHTNQLHNSGSSNMNMSSYNHQTQSLINRAMAQVSQSPLRRLGLHNPQGASSGLLSHMSSYHPMRAGHSSLSLASSSFIIEDKLQNEIRKLQSDLKSEKEKNEALNSQLNINSSLMAAFEQSLTTLNTRLRQLTTLNEKKDNEIEELREQLRSSYTSEHNKSKDTSLKDEIQQTDDDSDDWAPVSEINNNSERSMMIKTIEDLKRQLIEKDRLLTDTRLEALSAAHQLEQLESKLNGEHSILVNEDELDEGVMVVNHSPSDSDAITDSAHFSEINSQISKSNHQCNSNNISFNTTSNTNSDSNGGNFVSSSTDQNNTDDRQSNHSSDYQVESNGKERDQKQTFSTSTSQQFNETDSGVMCKLMDNLLLTN